MTTSSETKTRGRLILLEGLDRAGKTTQCRLLCDYLISLNGAGSCRVQKVPDRTTQIGQMINSYLASNTTLPDQSIHLLFSANRWELRESILSSLMAGQTVILDRYVPSGVAYSLAKGVDSMSLEWCTAPERGLPRPDLTIFLDIDPENAKLQSTRADFGQERYEVTEFQEKVRECFKKVLAKGALDVGPVFTIDACRTIEQVTADVVRAVDSVVVSGSEVSTLL
ncbi:thymidylate kinase Tmp1 [Myxozyma melibiosi]|uniref:dTMP kinase n=1 Tax=Myxozyma melibiosi TaxID=54550 RepID=A0ABR1F660_9ASCO